MGHATQAVSWAAEQRRKELPEMAAVGLLYVGAVLVVTA